MTAATVDPDQPRPILTVSEAAQLLGVSRWLVLQQVNAGALPHRRLGRRILLSRRQVLAWIDNASADIPVDSTKAVAADERARR